MGALAEDRSSLLPVCQACMAVDFVPAALSSYTETENPASLCLATDGKQIVDPMKTMF
jgi:hypothetical protein